MKGEDLNLIQMEIDRQTPGAAVPSQLAHQLESIAAVSRNLESTLNRERAYSIKLREYANNLISQLHVLRRQEKVQLDKIEELSEHSQRNAQQLATNISDLGQTRNELGRYKSAWSQVIAREKRASEILASAKATECKIRDLQLALNQLEQDFEKERSHRERAEQVVSAHRAELQTALVRLHSSEARFNDMNRELEAMHSLRKNHQLEIVNAQEKARSKADADFARIREQLESDLEEGRAQFTRQLSDERTRLERLLQESEQNKERLRKDLEARFRQEHHKALSEWEISLRSEQSQRDAVIRSLNDEVQCARAELTRARHDWAAQERVHQERVLASEQLARSHAAELVRLREDLQRKHDGELERLRSEASRSRQGFESHVQSVVQASDRREEMSQAQLEGLRREYLLLCNLIQADKRRVQILTDGLLNEWGSEDPALREALLALRGNCEVRTLYTEADPMAQAELSSPSELAPRLDLHSAGPKLSC